MTERDPIPEPGEAEKVAFLAPPSAYPDPPARVEPIEAHMSWVFLTDSRAWKLKKPVRRGPLDFSTLERRRAMVAEEVRLNRRLSPDVYLGAQTLTLRRDRGLALGPPGRVVDWLVVMRRLPEARTLRSLIGAGRARPEDAALAARFLARFYRGCTAEALPPGTHAQRFERQLLESGRVLGDPGLALGAAGLGRALDGAAEALERARPLIEACASDGRVVEGHGDLRPEHVFLTDPPAIIDCLEFSRALRLVDPFDEAVFLGLECARFGADWAVEVLCNTLAGELGGRPDPALLAFYWRYRALLRARLALLHLADSEVREPEKWRPLARYYVALSEEAALRTRP